MPLALVPASRARSRSFLLVGSLAAIAVLGLAGCSAEPTPEATPDATATAAPTDAATDEPTAEPTPSIEPGTPITIDCETLLTPQDIYDFNPNVSTDPGFEPAEGSLAALALADNGIACGYLHQTSNELMNFALSQPSPEQLTLALNAAAASSTPVPTYGTPPAVNGFFDPKSGEVQVFTPTYWLSATSTMFFEPGDAQTLVNAALSHLPE
ncbi:hypothetical protein [Microterricola viridarii]|uniref:Iron ABC transporter ATP-binding protein n=1 Tax=Microterricola viridarii TaxID=412690 RepID=A0A1H1RGS3_9MICO|nr:hypothetical protein [Microterricola viridarii]SDS34944.1 hypothetical protein SAMN04489834_1318 [Microterricola viridarii]